MTIYWPETPHAASSGDDDGFAFEVPDEVLRRHGARVLEPSAAADSAAGRAVRPTAYASSVLLIPRELLTPRNNDTLNSLFNQADMRLPLFGGSTDREPEAPVPPEELQTVPVVLRPTRQAGTVDAWAALQTVRAAAAENPESTELAELASQISLDHLMFASRWSGDLTGVPGAIQGFVPIGPGTGVSGYLDGPVAVELPPINYTGTFALDRPPVVAVLDTGIGHNTWLKIPKLDTRVRDISQWDTGPHVKVDAKIQKAVQDAGLYLQQQGHRVEVINHPKDEPLSRNPLVGTQAWCFGHGVFCAGVIAQIAPKATVLAVRVMGSDGVARESAVVAALKALVDRVEEAQRTGDTKKMVDIVSLSMGYLFERPPADEQTNRVAVQIKALRRLGVLVVAAAGNSASSQRFFPACLSTVSNELTTPPVISVGALNPNGSKALYTNEGLSVTCYATGTNVISTFPQDANASRQPSVQVRTDNRCDLPPYRQSPDVDDHTLSPFAVWTGSSFSAPHIAAHLANALRKIPSTQATTMAEQASERAADAVAAVIKMAQPPAPAP